MSKWSKSKANLNGVKYWAQWFPIHRIPRYEIYVYVGSDPTIGQYYFGNYKRPAELLCRNYYQLVNDPSFRPFVLDTKAIFGHTDLEPPPFRPRLA